MKKLRQLMLVEEFKRCINSDIKSFLDEKQVETLETAARLADDYTLTYKVSFLNKSNPSRRPFFPHTGLKPSLVIHLAVIAKHLLLNPNFLMKTRIEIPYLNQLLQKTGHSISACLTLKREKEKTRESCKKTGHSISACLNLKRENEIQKGLKPTGLTSIGSKPQSFVQEEIPTQGKSSETDSLMEIYEPFFSDGFVSLNSDYA